jgi:hypothetical protein
MDIGMVLLVIALIGGAIAYFNLGDLGQPANSKQHHGQKAKTHNQPQKQKQHQVKTKQQ